MVLTAMALLTVTVTPLTAILHQQRLLLLQRLPLLLNKQFI